jgi:hypothetical protein
MTKQIVKIGKKHEIRGFDIDFETGRLFIADYDRGNFYQYSVSTPVDCDSTIEEVCSHMGSSGARVIKYWEDREEIFVGFKKGKICVYQIDGITSGPICK